jgi:hypothetical protein
MTGPTVDFAVERVDVDDRCRRARGVRWLMSRRPGDSGDRSRPLVRLGREDPVDEVERGLRDSCQPWSMVSEWPAVGLALSAFAPRDPAWRIVGVGRLA